MTAEIENAADRSQKCPPLPPEKRVKPYQPSGAAPGHDGNPPEFMARRDFVYADGVREEVDSAENINIDRVTYLYNRKRIEWRQFAAAQKLERDWELSKIDPVASNVLVGNGGSGGGGQLPNDAKVMAMRRHGAARKALGRNWAIIELVVHEHLSVEKASARLQVHHKVGFGLMSAALHVLADFYRIA